MSSQNVLFAVAAIVLVVAALSLGFTYYSISNFKQGFLTGHVTANGTIYINITSSADINLTHSVVNWGNGSVASGTNYAVLSTSTDNVINGTWVPVSAGFALENIGNVNVSINIKSGKNSTQFIGGTSPLYQLNITNNETNSCIAGTATLGVYYDANSTHSIYACSNLSWVNTKDTILIDVKLGIPYDAPIANLNDQIEITAVQSSASG